ncbi:MAG: methyltransferase family protein [Promethearchaeota archaeon]
MGIITIIIFIITLTASILLVGGLIFTLIMPKYRIWPPPSKKSWQFWISWVVTIISFVGTIILSVLDWKNFIFIHWFRYPIGISLIVIGLFILIWGVRTLSVHSTLGLKGKLIKDGPYKYSRNPQYLADIILYAGLIILANSFFTLITGILGILWNFLTPFTEEPWLKEQFKEEYDIYCREVRRFI